MATISDDELRGIAQQTLNMAKHDIEKGDFNFLVAAYNVSDTPPLLRMKRVETIIVEKLGENWLNSGHTKDAGFATLRLCVDLLPPDAMVFVTAANGFAITPKFRELAEAEQVRLLEAGHDRHHRAVAEGLLTVADLLTAWAQTPERVGLYTMFVDGSEPPQWKCGPQSDFDGRLKMYGTVYGEGKKHARTR